MPLINKALSIKDLPPPPPDRIGWPWTEGNQPLPAQMPDGSEWPRISIVTPSYNYDRFIEETIRSILLQGYPNLEYIVIDGGSKDNTVEIIKKYEKYLTYWVSEPDGGQTDAINKGFHLCTGEIFAWLNADDCYADPTCLQNVGSFYANGYELIAGSCVDVYSDGKEEIVHSVPVDFSRYLRFWSYRGLPQPSVFIAKKIADKCFPLDRELYGLMDYQLFLRTIYEQPNSIYINKIWTKVKYHGNSKTEQNYQGALSEYCKVSLGEAKKLSSQESEKFTNELQDYIIIFNLLQGQSSPTLKRVISSLASRYRIARWPVFWKIFLQAAMPVKAGSPIKNKTG